MAEYVTKEQVKEEILSWARSITNPERIIMADAMYVIDMLPSADVRPVVRGRWVKVGGFVTPGGDPVWECSECGKGRHVYGIEHGTYGAEVSDGQWVACPNCGADMRGENDG